MRITTLQGQVKIDLQDIIECRFRANPSDGCILMVIFLFFVEF